MKDIALPKVSALNTISCPNKRFAGDASPPRSCQHNCSAEGFVVVLAAVLLTRGGLAPMKPGVMLTDKARSMKNFLKYIDARLLTVALLSTLLATPGVNSHPCHQGET